MDKQLLTPKEAANALGVHLNTMYRLISTNEIPALRLGPRLIRIQQEDLHNYLKGQSNANGKN